MTDFIVKKFVKNYEDVSAPKVRTEYGTIASIVGILCNVLLFATKFFVGLFMKSIAITADAFNNLSDAASSVISLIGVKLASKPADEEHPFGHGRMEYIAAFVVAFLVLQVGFSLFKGSIEKIRTPEELTFEIVPMLILACSVLLKLWLYFFNHKIGKRIDSQVLLAASVDCLGDVVITIVNIAAIMFFVFTGWNIDAYAGILVSLVVMWAGIGIAKDTIAPLLGEAIDPELGKAIADMVESYEGVVGTHDLVVHNYGPNQSMASIHAEVPRDVDIEVSHEIIDKIEREVSKELNVLLVIHMDPVEVHDETIVGTRNQVEQVVTELDSQIGIHDFRMVKGKNQTNLIFDIVIPFGYGKERQKELLKNIRTRMQKVDSTYQCVIHVDHSYIANQEPEK